MSESPLRQQIAEAPTQTLFFRWCGSCKRGFSGADDEALIMDLTTHGCDWFEALPFMEALKHFESLKPRQTFSGTTEANDV